MRDSINLVGLAHHNAFIHFVHQWATERKVEREKDNRIAELEAALTDALYAYGLIWNDTWETRCWPSNTVSFRVAKEAEERIQRARLALPKAQEAT